MDYVGAILTLIACTLIMLPLIWVWIVSFFSLLFLYWSWSTREVWPSRGSPLWFSLLYVLDSLLFYFFAFGSGKEHVCRLYLVSFKTSITNCASHNSIHSVYLQTLYSLGGIYRHVCQVSFHTTRQTLITESTSQWFRFLFFPVLYSPIFPSCTGIFAHTCWYVKSKYSLQCSFTSHH